MKKQAERDVALDRVATDSCALPAKELGCALEIARRSQTPVAMAGDGRRAWQIQGRFTGLRTASERLALARELLTCLGRDDVAVGLRAAKDGDSRTDGVPGRFELRYRRVPVYRSGIAFGAADDGSVESITVAAPVSKPSAASWGDPRDAEQTVRKRWDLDDVQAPWRFGSPRRIWYVPALVYGTDEDEGWEAAWLFSRADAETPYDVIVSADGGSILDTGHTGPGMTLAPLPRFHIRPETGVLDFITWGQTGLLLPEASSGSPEKVARALFDRYPRFFGTGDSARQLLHVRTDASLGPARTRHVVFQQVFGTYPVFGCELRVHLSPTLAVLSVSGNYLRDPQVSLEAPVTEVQAMNAVTVASSRGDDREIERPSELQSKGLVVFPSVLAPAGGAINHLAWWFRSPRWDWFVSAQSGAVIYRLNTRLSHRLTYDANQITSGEKLEVRDGTDLTGGSSDPDSLPVDGSVAGVEAFWLLFGRSAWNGSGGDDISVVDYPLAGNATWTNAGNRVEFDRNFTTPEIVGHEFTHGVVQATSGLHYIGESGALNESFADVFGLLMFPGSPPGWIARLNDGTQAKNLANPPIGTYSQLSKSPLDDFSVHGNSGIGSRCAVLTCNGDGTPAHAGINRELTARLWWDAMTLRLHPWATYLDFCHVVRETVRDLARLGAPGVTVPASPSAAGAPVPTFDATTVAEVDWALTQVGLNPSLLSGWFTIPDLFLGNITLFQGAQVPPDQVVSDADVIVTRRRDADLALFLFGRARVSEGGTFVDQSGTIRVVITASGVGTRSKEITAKFFNISSVPFESEGVVYTQQVSPPSPPPPTTSWTSPVIAHWFDNPFFLGRKYGDIVFEAVGLPAPCSVLDVRLELLQLVNGVLVPRAQTRLGQPAAVWGGTGAVIPMPPTVPGSLEVRVRSWHEFGWIVRYRLVYDISGTCVPTGFGSRGVDPFTFT